MKKILITIFVLFVSTAPAAAEVHNVPVSQDTFIDSCYSNKVMGDETVVPPEELNYQKLWIGEVVNPVGYTALDGSKGPGFNDAYFARTFLTFDLSGYSDINGAYLYLCKNQQGTQGWETKFYNETGRYLGIGVGSITVRNYIGPAWSESILKWNNSGNYENNTLMGELAKTRILVDTTTTWVNFDVTEWAQNATGGQLSLALGSNDPFSIFYSSENGNANLAPYLKLNASRVVPEPMSAGLFLLGGASLALLRKKRKS